MKLFETFRDVAGTLVQITDKREVLIENCRKIMEFGDIFLKVKTGNLVVQVWGNNLQLFCRGRNAVIVRGVIDNVEMFSIKSGARNGK